VGRVCGMFESETAILAGHSFNRIHELALSARPGARQFDRLPNPA
jgi:hypothetical protein